VLFAPLGETERATNPTDRPFREILIELKALPSGTVPEAAVANYAGPPTLTPG